LLLLAPLSHLLRSVAEEARKPRHCDDCGGGPDRIAIKDEEQEIWLCAADAYKCAFKAGQERMRARAAQRVAELAVDQDHAEAVRALPIEGE
jgi:ribosomal protein L37AE/L43A